MATFQVTPPETFDFSKPVDWPKWLKRFERFSSASGLSEQEEEQQVNTLIYCMGPKADEIFATFGLTADEATHLSTVKDKFLGYFIIRRNVIYERAKFNARKQLSGELVDTFITDLYSLAEHCNYGALREEMIRDRIVVGLRDGKLSEKLQMDAKLTLLKAVNLARQSESVKSQQTSVRSNGAHSSTADVDALKRGKSNWKKNDKKPERKPEKWHKSTSEKHYGADSKCSWCGCTPNHDRANCPAKEVTCHECSKVGHYARVCRSKGTKNPTKSKQVNVLEGDPQFLGEMSAEGSRPWMVTLSLKNVDVQFKVDTGADVTAIPEQTFAEIFEASQLQPSDRTLYGPGQTELETTGMLRGTLCLDSNQNGRQQFSRSCQDIYVVRNLNQALLGRPAIEALKILSKGNLSSVVEQSEELAKYKKEFPKLFSGLGKLEGAYRIDLKEDAKPYAITTPRNVPLPLMSKVKEELS